MYKVVVVILRNNDELHFGFDTWWYPTSGVVLLTTNPFRKVDSRDLSLIHFRYGFISDWLRLSSLENYFSNPHLFSVAKSRVIMVKLEKKTKKKTKTTEEVIAEVKSAVVEAPKVR